MEYTEPQEIFNEGTTQQRAKYSDELKAYKDKKNAFMKVYRILKKTGSKYQSVYIGIAMYQPLYKTITRHFQKHNDPSQGRYVIPEKKRGLYYFQVSKKTFSNIADLKDEEAAQILAEAPEGNRIFNTGQKDMGRPDPETGEIDPNWRPPKWETAKKKAQEVLAYYDQPTELGFVKAEQAREWLKEHRRLSQIAYRKDPILINEIPKPEKLWLWYHHHRQPQKTHPHHRRQAKERGRPRPQPLRFWVQTIFWGRYPKPQYQVPQQPLKPQIS